MGNTNILFTFDLTKWLNHMVKANKDQSTEERILAAAKKIFVAKGIDGARMQDIADEAGINKALVHYYFRSKEQLFEVIFKSAANRIFPGVNQILLTDLPVFEKIRKFTDFYLSIIIDNPYLPLFVLNEVNKSPVIFIEKIFGDKKPDLSKFVAQIAEEVRLGIIKPVNPTHLIINMMSMCIFPFVARPMMQMVLGIDELEFRYMMEQRKKLVAEFIIDSIKK